MKNNTYRYIDKLHQLVQSYNLTPHRSLGNIPPARVDSTNETKIWAHLYLHPQPVDKIEYKRKKHRRRLFAFKIGQLVRISHLKSKFTRSYDEQWSYEIYKISRRFFIQGIPLYKPNDLLGQTVTGNFYQSELQSVNKNAESLWQIEKIIRKRTMKGVKQVFVKWKGYPKRFNSWIDEAEIQNMN